MYNTMIVNDYRQMNKVIKEDRQYNILDKDQKSRLQRAIDLKVQSSSYLSLNFFSRLKILVMKDVKQDEIELGRV